MAWYDNLVEPFTSIRRQFYVTDEEKKGYKKNIKRVNKRVETNKNYSSDLFQYGEYSYLLSPYIDNKNVNKNASDYQPIVTREPSKNFIPTMQMGGSDNLFLVLGLGLLAILFLRG